MLRSACVAGQFYPAGAVELEAAVRGFLTGGPAKKAVAAVAPHAGYVYSGPVAGAVFSSIEIPDDIILIGPNHTGLGQKVSIMTTGTWEMPFGRMEINEGLAASLLKSSALFSEDGTAHINEHSLEVELPFIHYLNPDASFVPITVMQAGYGECVEAGAAIAKAVSAYGEEVLIVVSSDMNHYESDSTTRKKDNLAIEKVLSLDAKGLLETTSQHGISMCGVIPAAIAIEAAKRLGAKEGRLVKYATSGDTSGDLDHVVGYAGIVIQ
jgi:AmmeMemoRadiSam system protein B